MYHLHKKQVSAVVEPELKTLHEKRTTARVTSNRAGYVQAKKNFRKAFRKAKRAYYRNQLVATAGMHNPFRAVKRLIPELNRKGGKQRHHFKDDMAIAESLGIEFKAYGGVRDEARRVSELLELLHNLGRGGDIPIITEVKLVTAVKYQRRDTAPGPDGLTYSVWARIIETWEFRQDILRSMQHILESGTLPTSWRDAEICPIPKGKQAFRPISLLNSIAKVMERIVSNRLKDEFTPRETQFGCRPGHSAPMALVRLLHQSAMSYGEGKELYIMSMDLSKAYDRVNRAELLRKLIHRGISSYLIHFIGSWFIRRHNKVSYNGVLGPRYTTLAGLPQGSTLSVVLWQIYVDDLPVPNSNCQLYMDDILIWAEGRSHMEAASKLQRLLKPVEIWCNRLQMIINTQKTYLIANEIPSRGATVKFCGTCYYPSTRIRYLGMTLESFDDGGYLRANLTELKRDVRRRVSLLRRVSRFCTTNVMSTLTKAFILGKINYVLPVVGNEDPEVRRQIEVAINEAMRLDTGAFPSTPIPLLHIRSGFPDSEALFRYAAGSLWKKIQFGSSLREDL